VQPGTCLFWDSGYATKLPDLDFLPAALLLTRVVSQTGNKSPLSGSRPQSRRFRNPHPRVQLLELPNAKAVTHSEEHLSSKPPKPANSRERLFYGMPWHICPTVALHSEAVVIKNGRAEERWRILARDRKLTILGRLEASPSPGANRRSIAFQCDDLDMAIKHSHAMMATTTGVPLG